MRALQLIVLPFALFTSACAYPIYGTRSAPYQARMVMAPAQPPSPVGRWDNVMMLDPGAPALVLQMDGTRTHGRFHSASPAILRIHVGEAVAEIAATDVARVDRLPHLGGSMDEGVRGAAVGLGAVGVIGLIAGRTPPVRHWAAGALIGGYAAGQSHMAAAGSGAIYLAPVGPAAEPPPRRQGDAGHRDDRDTECFSPTCQV